MAGAGSSPDTHDGSRAVQMKPAESCGKEDNSGGRASVERSDDATTRATDNTTVAESQAAGLCEKRSSPGLAGDAGRPAASLAAAPAAVKPLNSPDSSRRPISPHRARQPHMASPVLPILPSPRVHSPASSLIFERSVQEDIAPAQTSPSIPSHIMTENHIPPILDASSEALTDERLNPDSVEIITHNYHQPASLPVTGGAYLDQHHTPHGWHESDYTNVHEENEDSLSNYGTLDSADVKRLSFVSFADLIHGEREQQAEASEYRSNRTSINPGSRNRSPSPFPLHSPTTTSSPRALGTSPPTSLSSPPRTMANAATETSPHRGGRLPGSPGLCAYSPPPPLFNGGELSVETMSQALRRTGSGELGGFRSQPMSAVGSGDSALDRDHLFK
ncbi:hypothetical protein VTO42DRAFT_4333 [Malbranchea cinnamomea]